MKKFLYNRTGQQSGRLLIEMILVFALIALLAPMIYRAQIDKKTKDDDLITAHYLAQITRAVKNYMENNISHIRKGFYKDADGNSFPWLIAGVPVADNISIYEIRLGAKEGEPGFDAELMEFLPVGFQLKRKIFNDIIVGIRREVVSDTEINIGTLIVTDFIYTPSKMQLNDIIGTIGVGAGITVNDSGIIEAVSSGNVWRLPIVNFFTSPVGENEIVLSTEYISETVTALSTLNKDEGYLHRDDSAGDPTTTTMHEDLDMGNNAITHITKITKEEDFSRFFNTEFVGKNLYGDECGARDNCISINGEVDIHSYTITPSGTSLFDDVYIKELNSNKLSDLIPPMILIDVQAGQKHGDVITPSQKCPTGYMPQPAVIPSKWIAYRSKVDPNWPFYGANFKNNDGDTGFWGSGYSCAKINLSPDAYIFIYLQDNKVRTKIIGNDDPTNPLPGGQLSNTSISVDLNVDPTMPISDVQGVSCLSPSSTFYETEIGNIDPIPGKLQITHTQNIDICGMTNDSSLFTCNQTFLDFAKVELLPDSNTELLRFEFYFPIKELSMRHGSDITSSMIPINEKIDVTLPDGSQKKAMQTTGWTLNIADGSNAPGYEVEADIYIYCKFISAAFD